jgi:hypothetical protein
MRIRKPASQSSRSRPTERGYIHYAVDADVRARLRILRAPPPRPRGGTSVVAVPSQREPRSGNGTSPPPLQDIVGST